jgi:hypothetical protein
MLMRSWRNAIATLALGSAAFVGACGKGRDATANNANGDVAAQPGSSAAATPSSNASGTTAATPADSTQSQHHSKLAGAAVGAAAGHMLGGHAVAGAAAGALVQHARNKSNKH